MFWKDLCSSFIKSWFKKETKNPNSFHFYSNWQKMRNPLKQENRREELEWKIEKRKSYWIYSLPVRPLFHRRNTKHCETFYSREELYPLPLLESLNFCWTITCLRICCSLPVIKARMKHTRVLIIRLQSTTLRDGFFRLEIISLIPVLNAEEHKLNSDTKQLLIFLGLKDKNKLI